MAHELGMFLAEAAFATSHATQGFDSTTQEEIRLVIMIMVERNGCHMWSPMADKRRGGKITL